MSLRLPALGLKVKVVVALSVAVLAILGAFVSYEMERFRIERMGELRATAQNLANLYSGAVASSVWEFDKDNTRSQLEALKVVDGFQRAVAIKNVTFNEPFFQGHWPEQPIMPGVLQLEAMAQLSGVLLLRKLENTGKLAVLWSIDKVKLRGAVVPGDQLRIEVETIRAKPQVGHVRARCKVAGRLVAEAELKFTLVDA